MVTTTHFRTCPLCEATCGLELTMNGDTVVRVRGDDDDVFSKGFICPKGTAVKQLHEDPDRLRAPMLRERSEWRAVSWDEAFAAVEAGLKRVIEQYGRDAVAEPLTRDTRPRLEPGYVPAQPPSGPALSDPTTRRAFSSHWRGAWSVMLIGLVMMGFGSLILKKIVSFRG